MDNQKACVLKPDGMYERVTEDRSESIRVQEYLYMREIEEQERIRSLTPVRFVPIEGQ
jgi:hypothetical protein